MADHSPEQIGNTLQGMLKEMGIEKKINQYRILDMWQEIVGEQIASHTKADKIRDKVLHVKVKSMTWRTELMFQKSQILQRIADKVGNDLIKDIRFF